MPSTSCFPLVAVDVGQSRIKLGDFEHPLAEPLPHPRRAVSVDVDWTDAELESFLPREAASYAWSIASVNRPAAARLIAWLEARDVSRVTLLTCADLPLQVDLPCPDRVGLDRLVNAVAVNRLRTEGRAAIVLDFGSAITVDRVSTNGAFAGGAILAGTSMSARALHAFTDLLPLVDVDEPPPALGKSTLAAISSGLYWGTIGAVRELVARLAEDSAAEIFLTGGAAPPFATILHDHGPCPPQFVPHLTLAGIALAASGHEPPKALT